MACGAPTWTVAFTHRSGYFQTAGTSMATPLLAGGVACHLQVHPHWSISDLRKALFDSGSYFIRHGEPDCLFAQGYGMPDLFEAAGLDGSRQDKPKFLTLRRPI